MSDGSLSQDEIDALLSGSGDMSFDSDSQSGGEELSNQEKQAFQNILNSIVSSQASNFSMLVNKQVNLNNPTVEVISQDQFVQNLPDQVVDVNLQFSQGLEGEHYYILSQDIASKIAGLFMGQNDVELDDAALNALQEAVSQINGPVITKFGDTLNTNVMTSPAQAQVVSSNEISIQDNEFVNVTYPLTIEGEQPSQINVVFSVSAVKQLAAATSGQQQNAPNQQQANMGMMGQQQQNMGQFQQPAQQNMGMQQGPQQFGGMPGGQMGGMQGGFMGQQSGPNVQSVQYPNLQQGQSSHEQGNISLLMDVYMEMTVELGRTKKLIKEILGMGEGTIIELDKLAGEPVDILVNHKLIAKGEVVVIDENFGVRVTEIVSPIERMEDLTGH